MEKTLYVIIVKECYNYGFDCSCYYTDDYGKACDWVEENYPDAEEDEDGWVDKDADVRISIESASEID